MARPNFIPDSLPVESLSQRYDVEPTQMSQPRFSQTQNTQGTLFPNSQVEPRRKYWAIFVPMSPLHAIWKLPWSKPRLQIGRGPVGLAGNDLILTEKRVSNKHCRITLGLQGEDGASGSSIQAWRDGESEPDVWLEDLGSSNGTFVNGERLRSRRLLQQGDEISLGHIGALDNHDVRFIYRSVGAKGTRMGHPSRGGPERVGEVYERYQLLDRLGKGSFAEVRKAVDVETGDLRAIKQIVKRRFANNPKTLQLFEREIDICQRLQHDNICRLIEWFEDPQHIYLVLEYVNGGDLLDYIMNFQGVRGAGLPEDQAAIMTFQICSAMAYTHSMGVTHRDLKPENILLTHLPDTDELVVKIADFGLAKMVHAGTMLTSMVGTPQYLAPEVVMQDHQKPGYENKVDSWAVGIIVYSMLTKALPFDEDQEMPVEQRIRQRFTQPFDSNLLVHLGVSPEAMDFISGLLAKNSEERLSMTQALEHPWLSGPSSQPMESQGHRLGGDSYWNIEEFDHDHEVEEISSDIEIKGRWSRPMTASGTNFEGENGHYPSDESFSQPMHNLRLQTPAAKSTLAHQHLPSPPLTAMSITATNGNANGDTNRHANGKDPASATASSKLAAVTPKSDPVIQPNMRRRPLTSAFDSDSLSPPPEDAPTEVATSPLRRSMRNVTRPRKSMRLA